jgi:hypothetical protein
MVWSLLQRASSSSTNDRQQASLTPVEKLRRYYELAKVSSCFGH